MKVAFGCDHAAIDLKNELLKYLTEKGYECIDFGAQDPNVKVNYPEPGLKVAEAIMRGEADKGVLICGTGIGISLLPLCSLPPAPKAPYKSVWE